MALGRDLSGNQPAPNFEMRWLGAIEFLERTDMPVQAGRALASPSRPHPFTLYCLGCFLIRQRTAYVSGASTHAHGRPLQYIANQAPAREPHL
jgi:hypothetical protein